jgi:hypothetical protein
MSVFSSPTKSRPQNLTRANFFSPRGNKRGIFFWLTLNVDKLGHFRFRTLLYSRTFAHAEAVAAQFLAQRATGKTHTLIYAPENVFTPKSSFADCLETQQQATANASPAPRTRGWKVIGCCFAAFLDKTSSGNEEKREISAARTPRFSLTWLIKKGQFISKRLQKFTYVV